MSNPTEFLIIYHDNYVKLIEILNSITEDKLSRKTSEKSWTIKEYVIHLTDTEAVYYIRFRKTIAEELQPGLGFDQEAWANEFGYQTQDLETNLEVLRILRQSNYNLLKGISVDKWLKKFNHPRFGILTLKELLNKNNLHFNDHLNKIKKTIDAK